MELIYINACMRAGSRTQRPVADNHTLEDRNHGIVPAEHTTLAKREEVIER